MAISIVHTTAVDGVLSNIPFNLSGTTAANNALIVAISIAVEGAVIASIVTNAGDSVAGLPFSTDTDASYNQSGSELTTAIFWIPTGIGGATTMTIIASASFDAWVYEVHSGGLALDAATFRDSTVGGNGITATGPALVGTGSSDLYVACMTAGAIVSVGAPWTLDPTTIVTFEFDFGGAHLISTGTKTPVFTQTSTGRWSVSGAAFKEVNSLGNCPTRITGGNFMDPLGNRLAYGFLSMRLMADTLTCTLNGQLVAGRALKIPLDKNGNIAGVVNVEGNDLLLPAGSQYRVQLYSADGRQAWATPHFWTIPSNATVDIGTLAPS